MSAAAMTFAVVGAFAGEFVICALIAKIWEKKFGPSAKWGIVIGIMVVIVSLTLMPLMRYFGLFLKWVMGIS